MLQFPSLQAQPEKAQAQVSAPLLPRPGRPQARPVQRPALRLPVQLHGEQRQGATHRAQGAQVLPLRTGPGRPQVDRSVRPRGGPHGGEPGGSGGP